MKRSFKKIGMAVLIATVVGIFANDVRTVLAWTGPSASAPGGNVSAPLNVGTASQVKNGSLGVNGLAVYGNSLVWPGTGTGGYLNFDYTAAGTSGSGSAGYGIRDNAGTLEFKNYGGSWANLNTTISNYISLNGGGSQWTTNGTSIYYNSGNVGIGATSPTDKLDVSGALTLRSADHSSYVANTLNLDYSPSVGASRIQSGNGSGLLLLNPYGGNVGVATTSPGAKFAVAGSGFFTGNIAVGNTGSMIGVDQGGVIELKATSGTALPYFDWGLTGRDYDFRQQLDLANNNFNLYSSTTASILTLKGNGNVGIRTSSPASSLHVNGNALFGNGSTASQAYIRGYNNGYSGATNPDYTWWYSDQTGLFHPAGNVIGFTTGGAERMRIDASGYVGIGATNPIRPLTVGGGGEISIIGNGSNAGYINLSDSSASNGGNYTLVLRGLGTNGTAQVNLSQIQLLANSVYVPGDIYSGTRGMWMSSAARKDGGQYWKDAGSISGAYGQCGAIYPNGTCTSGSVMVGISGSCTSTGNNAVGWSSNYTVQILCQWIN